MALHGLVDSRHTDDFRVAPGIEYAAQPFCNLGEFHSTRSLRSRLSAGQGLNYQKINKINVLAARSRMVV